MSALNNEIHPLISNEIRETLTEKRIYTIYQFINQDPQVLAKITKLAFKDILIVKRHILKNNSAIQRNALDYHYEMLQQIVSTYYSKLDDILEGGFYTGNIYEICAVSSPLRTKFLYKFIVHFTTEHQNNEAVMFYDTKNGFNALYLKYISAQLYGSVNVIDNLFIQQTKDIYELIQALYVLKDKLIAKSFKLKVVIIDSLPPILYHTTRIDKLNMMLNALIGIIHYIMIEFHVCFIVANLLNGEWDQIDTCLKVAGGKYWQTLPNVRLRLIECKDPNKNKCVITILKNNQGADTKKCEIEV